MSKVQKVGLCALLAVSGTALGQQDAPVRLADVVVSSPIIESNTSNRFSMLTTAVTDSQVKDLGALDLAAALRMTPGVQISRYNEVGSYSGDQGGNVYIRGMGMSRPGSEIKTYIDGLPVYMGLWNHPLMDLLPLNGVKSIQIQKGPDLIASGNNFAAIHLETKRAQQSGLRGEVHAGYGSNATKILQANILGKFDVADFMLATGYVDSTGARANSDGELANALGRLAFRLGSHWSAGLGFLTVSNRVGDPGDNRYPTSRTGVGPYTFSNGIARNETSSNMVNVFISHQHDDWKGDFKIFQNRGENNLRNDPSWGTFDSSFTMTGLRWKETIAPWKNGQIVAGVDYDSIRGEVSGPHVGSAVGTPFAFNSAGSASVPAFRLLSTYVGLNHRFELARNWVLQPSVALRHFDSNHYGSKTAPQAGLSLIGESLTIYANYAEGILYPGAETYSLTRAIPMAFSANNGWDRLSPSENKHTEIGFGWDATASTHVDVSFFRDAISKRYIWSGFNSGAFSPPASGTWSNSFPDYESKGAELSVQQRIGQDWIVFGGYTRLDSDLDNLPYVPRNAFSLGVNGQVAGFRLTLDAQRQSGMYTLTQDRGTFSPNKVDGFTVANVRVARPLALLGKGGDVYVSVNNLTDANYQYNAGYPMPGRTFRVGANITF